MPSDLGHRPPALVTVSGALIAYIHTALGLLAFVGALLVALSLHYHKVVKNGIAGWPQEYWPSVSATIGDWYPERNLFQIGIALMSGPRFLLVFLSALLVSLSKPGSSHAIILLLVGTLRTFSCGGWVFVTSTDDHDVHDICMAAYLILTPPWMYITSGSLAAQPTKEASLAASPSDRLANQARRMRRFAASAFFGMMPSMVLFFYRHKVLEIPGAYTQYAFFEWGLIIFDLLFDCASTYDLSRLELHVVEASNPSGSSGSSRIAGQTAALIGGEWIEGGTAGAVASGAWSTPPQQANARQGLDRGTGAGHKLNQKSVSVSFSSDLLSFCAESYLAFCFWSTLTALHPSIFFFSVYNMGVGGHEALLLTQVFAMAFTTIPAIRRRLLQQVHSKVVKAAAQSQVGYIGLKTLLLLYTLSLTGLAVWMMDDRLTRLLGTAASCAGFAVLYALQWGHAWEAQELNRTASTFIVGLLLSSVAKYANHSNNPAWPLLNSTNGGRNLIALLLAIAAVAERLISQSRQTRSPKSSTSVARKPTSWINSAIATCSMGALIFSLHVILSDSGSMIAWTWTGYPIKGPMALPHGRYILLTSALALYASIRYTRIACHPLFWAAGLLSTWTLIYCEDWLGFAGALGLAAFLPPLAFPIMQVTLQSDPLYIMLGAWLVADLLAFFQVLTVAYAFIPGGQVMRERTPLMMLVTMMMLLGGLVLARRSQAERHTLAAARRKLSRLAAIPLLLLSLFSLVVPSYRQVAPSDIQPFHPSSRVITAGIWTVHFSLDQDMWDSTRRMSSILKELQLEIIGLLETDLHRTVFGNRDLTQFLSEELGMYADIGPGPDKHTWGAVLLSKFPIINSTHHLLPSPHGELAPAIHAVLDIYGIPTHVLVSHNGQEEDALDRELQTTEIARIAREAYPHPFIFLGYVVTNPHASRPDPYQILFTDGKLLDVDGTDYERWCQYIGFRALQRVGYARVSRFTVSDTEIQTAKFRIPKVGDPPIDPDRDSNPMRGYSAPEEGWQYPHHLIDPPAKVYEKHKYSPYFYPFYYFPLTH